MTKCKIEKPTEGYSLFLPAIAAAIRDKNKSDSQESEKEFKSIVAITFRDSMIEFTKDSLLFRQEIPIDIFAGVQRYDIVPPKGFLVEDVNGFTTNKTKIPQNTYDNQNLYLTCCPSKDIYAAFYVEAALSPMRSSNTCKLPVDFLERYYDAILTNMFMRLANMTGRTWRSLGSSEEYKRRYEKFLRQAKRRALTNGAPIGVSYKRLSNAAC